MDAGIILGDVKINRPGPQGVGQALQRGVENGAVLPVVVFRQQAGFGRIGAKGIEQGMGHVGLEADGFGTVGLLKRVDHRLPAMHSPPANFTLRS